MTLEFSRVTPAAALDVDQAKVHLHITGTAHDADIEQKLDTAQDQVIALLGPAVDPLWDETTVPKPVKHSILILTSAFYEVRGGDDPTENLDKSLAVIHQLLGVYRDPVIK